MAEDSPTTDEAGVFDFSPSLWQLPILMLCLCNAMLDSLGFKDNDTKVFG